MDVKYKLGKTNSGKYQNLFCEDENAIIREIGIYGLCDSISFRKRNSDNSTFGSLWDLNGLACFGELINYKRLIDIPQKDLEKLAWRMYELLYENMSEEKYKIIPNIDKNNPRFIQINRELTSLQSLERELVSQREIIWPQVSSEELSMRY